MKMLIFFLIRTHLAPRVNEGAHIDETTIIEQQYNRTGLVKNDVNLSSTNPVFSTRFR